eukprot:5212047-Amphidinium_carterae.1
MEATVNGGALPPLTEKTINYIIAMDKDTEEDRLCIQQVQDIDDDLQSIIDQHIRELWEEENEDGQARFAKEQMRTVQDDWDDDARAHEVQERYERRQEQDRPRHEGTESALRERYQALHQMVITGRGSGLEAAQRGAVHGNTQEAERPPPAVIQVPASRTPIQQLREKVQSDEERQRLNAGGYYKKKNDNNYELYQNVKQKKNVNDYKLTREDFEEELQEQVAQRGIPEERFAQLNIGKYVRRDIIKIIEYKATTAVEDSDEHYWQTIFEYMSNNWLEEKGITTSDELHEGVLYWMKLEDIKDLLKRSQRGEPEAAKRMENYYVDMDVLEKVLRKKLEDNYGRIEETEEFIPALRNKENMKLKDMVYK